MQHPLLAEECLRQVLQLEKSVKEDTYLFPYATVELALLAGDQGDTQLAIGFLEDAKLVSQIADDVFKSVFKNI